MSSSRLQGLLSVKDFCRANKMPEGEFFRLLSAGRAPCIMRIGGKIRISPEAAQEWREISTTPSRVPAI